MQSGRLSRVGGGGERGRVIPKGKQRQEAHHREGVRVGTTICERGGTARGSPWEEITTIGRICMHREKDC